jgi:hypothetical protein
MELNHPTLDLHYLLKYHYHLMMKMKPELTDEDLLQDREQTR